MEEEKKAKKAELLLENNGYANGHASYMVCGVGFTSFLDWAAQDKDAEEAGVSWVRESLPEYAGGTIFFETYEKFPEIGSAVSRAFPEGVVYEAASWDGIYAACYRNGEERGDLCACSLSECFEDEGNVRMDFEITDNVTGSSLGFGDLICFDSSEEVEEFLASEEFDSLAEYSGMSKGAFRSQVEQVFEIAAEYWRGLEKEAD